MIFFRFVGFHEVGWVRLFRVFEQGLNRGFGSGARQGALLKFGLYCHSGFKSGAVQASPEEGSITWETLVVKGLIDEGVAWVPNPVYLCSLSQVGEKKMMSPYLMVHHWLSGSPFFRSVWN